MRPEAFVFSDAPYAGGAESYLLAHLHAAGPDRLGIVAIARPGLQDWLREREREGFTVSRLPAGSLPSESRAWFDWVRRHRPRLVHLNLPGPYDGLRGLGPAVARMAGAARVVVTEHLPSVGRVGKRYWAKRAGVRAVDSAICVCQAHRSWLIEVFGYPSRRVHVVPNGVPDPLAETDRSVSATDLVLRESTGGPRVVQVGSLEPRKGPANLIEAVARLRDEGVDLRLWLIGDGPERPSLERLVAERGLRGRVLLAGARADAASLFAYADIAALASEREGMPLSLLEAAAWGRAILTTDVDGCPEVVDYGRAGVLVPPGDVGALVRGLAGLVSDSRHRQRLGRRARLVYERHHLQSMMLRGTFACYGAVAEDWAL